MFVNLKFVEDVVREIFVKVKECFRGRIYVRVISNESIYKYDVIVEMWS